MEQALARSDEAKRAQDDAARKRILGDRAEAQASQAAAGDDQAAKKAAAEKEKEAAAKAKRDDDDDDGSDVVIDDDEEKRKELPCGGFFDFPIIGGDALRSTSFFVFPAEWKVRNFVYNVMSHRIFEGIIILLIVANCVFLALDDPLTEDIPVYQPYVDYFFTTCFTLEMVMKLFSLGFFGHKGAYLRDPWNILDFCIVCLSYLNFVPGFGNYTALRTLRVLRPLRSMNAVKQLKALVVCLIASVRGLVHVAILAFFTLLVFAILAVQLFGGLLRQHCQDTVTGEVDMGSYCKLGLGNDQITYAGYGCPSGSRCMVGDNPNFGLQHFDSTHWAFLSLVGLMTFDNWTQVLEAIYASFGVYGFLYFFAFGVICSYFIPNLALAVINEEFEEARAKVIADAKKRAEALRRAKNSKAVLVPTAAAPQAVSPPPTEQQAMPPVSGTSPANEGGESAQPSKTAGGAEGSSGNPLSLLGLAKLVRQQQEEADAATAAAAAAAAAAAVEDDDATTKSSTGMVGRFNPDRIGILTVMKDDGTVGEKRVYMRPRDKSFIYTILFLWNIWRDMCFWLSDGFLRPLQYDDGTDVVEEAPEEEVLDPEEDAERRRHEEEAEDAEAALHPPTLFTKFIIGCILINTIFLASQFEGQPELLTSIQTVANRVLTAIFALEMIIKLSALGFKKYMRDPFNDLDGLIVLLSFVELALAGSNTVSVFRALRLLRILKLLRSFPALRQIVKVTILAMKDTAYLLIIILLYLFIASLSGIAFFGGKMVAVQRERGNRMTFDSFPEAFYSVFTILTLESWSPTMYEAMHAVSELSVVYFIICVIIGNYILLNLFLSILISSFDELEADTPEGGIIDDLMMSVDLFDVNVAKRMFSRGRLSTSTIGNMEFPGARGSINDKTAAEKTATDEEEEQDLNGVYAPPELVNCEAGPAVLLEFTPMIQRELNRAQNYMKKRAAEEVANGKLVAQTTEDEWYEDPDDAMARTASASGMFLLEAPSMLIATGSFAKAGPSHSAAVTDDASAAFLDPFSNQGTTKTPGATPKGSFLDVPPPAGGDGVGGSDPKSPQFFSILPPTAQKGTSPAHGDTTSNHTARPTSGGPSRIGVPLPSAPTSPKMATRKPAAANVIVLGPAREADADDEKVELERCPICKQEMEEPLPAAPLILSPTPAKLHKVQCRYIAIRIAKERILHGLQTIINFYLVTKAPINLVKVELVVGQAWQASLLLHATLHDYTDSPNPYKKLAVDLEEQESILGLRVGEEQLGRSLIAFACANVPKVHRTNGGYSLFIFGPKNPVRVLCSEIAHSQIFERIVLLLIIASSLTMAFDSPLDDPQSTASQILENVNLFFTIAFTIEMVIKVVAKGFIFYKNTYLRDAWNCLDCFIVATSLLSLFLTGLNISFLRVFRTLRALRPLRVINRNRGLKIVVRTLMASVSGILNVVILWAINFLIFAILGVQLFSGNFNSCNDPAVNTRTDCVGNFTSVELNRTLDRAWAPERTNFDHVGNAVLALFEVGAGENWPPIMFRAVDGCSSDVGPQRNCSIVSGLYFVAFICIGGFFLINLFVGIVIHNFRVVKEEIDGCSLMTDDQKLWISTQQIMLNFSPPAAMLPTYTSSLSMALYRIVTRPIFDVVIAVAIMLNVIAIALDHYGQEEIWDVWLGYANDVFVAVFTAEAILKLLTFRLRYFRAAWNNFDFFLVMFSWLSIFLDLFATANLPIDLGVLRVFRLFRVLRILRLIKSARRIRILVETVFFSLPQLANIGAFVLLIDFMYGTLGVDLFAKVAVGDFSSVMNNRHANFQSLDKALMMLWRFQTVTDWNTAMHDCMIQEPYCSSAEGNCGTQFAPFFFCSFIIVTAYVTNNLLIGVILDNFETTIKLERTAIRMSTLHRFGEIWSDIDQDATKKIPTNAVPLLLAKLQPPLGVTRRQSRFELLSTTSRYRIPEHGGFVHFIETFIPLARTALENDSPLDLSEREQRKHESLWRVSFPELDELPILRYRQHTVTVDQYLCSTFIAGAYRCKVAMRLARRLKYEKIENLLRHCEAEFIEPDDVPYLKKHLPEHRAIGGWDKLEAPKWKSGSVPLYFGAQRLEQNRYGVKDTISITKRRSSTAALEAERVASVIDQPCNVLGDESESLLQASAMAASGTVSPRRTGVGAPGPLNVPADVVTGLPPSSQSAMVASPLRAAPCLPDGMPAERHASEIERLEEEARRRQERILPLKRSKNRKRVTFSAANTQPPPPPKEVTADAPPSVSVASAS